MSATRLERASPKVFQTANQAWRSTWSALLRMPLAFLLTTAAVVLLGFVLSSLGLDKAQVLAVSASVKPATKTALAILVHILSCSLVLAPLAIVIHRFVILGELTPVLPLRPMQRVLRFASWVAAFDLVTSLPTLLRLVPLPISALVASLVGLVIEVAVIFVTIRLALVFPAVAVQSLGRPTKLGWRETRWQFWRITCVLTLAGLPVFGVELQILALAKWFSPETTLQTMFASPLSYAFLAPYMALAAAAASWLFIGYGEADGQTAATTPAE